MKVIVGTDGSPGGLAALRWALDFCRQRHAAADDTLEVVHVYKKHELSMPLFNPTTFSPAGKFLTDRPGTTVALEASTVNERADLQDHYRHEAEQMLIDSLLAVGGGSGVHVTLTALAGEDHGSTLVDHAAHADLLVVGARGHSGLLSHLLGSVSTYCVNHARCPVVVARGH